MIEVQDEVLNGEPLYRMRDKDGNILFDNFTIEQITSILQEGTNINKYLFDNIKANVYLNGLYNQCDEIEITDSYQVLKFNYNLDKYEKGLIINLDTTPRENQITEFNTRIFPYFTGYETIDGFTAGTPGESGDDWEILDGDDTTYAILSSELIIKCPIYINPKSIYYYATEDTTNTAWMTVYGIENDGNEVLLLDKQFTTSLNETITLDTNEYFAAFKVKAYNVKTYIHEFSIESGFKSQLRTNMTNYINVNNLGEKMILGTLDINKKYKLVYDGTVFNATEVV